MYVPIEEEYSHWFLMVIHIVERRIYHLDTFLVVSKIECRQQQIRKIVSKTKTSMFIQALLASLIPDF